MQESIKVSIENYKTIDRISFTIKPVTVLVGPPNSGKSNILEALYVAGVPGKLFMASKEYEGSEELFCERDGAIGVVLRLSDPLDIFPDYNYENPVTIRTIIPEHFGAETILQIKAKLNELVLSLRISSKDESIMFSSVRVKPEAEIMLHKHRKYCIDIRELGALGSLVRAFSAFGGQFPADLFSFLVSPDEFEANSLSSVLLESRLYSYSRYMLDARLDELSSCPRNGEKCRVPFHVLAENAGNIAWIAYRKPDAVSMLNAWLNEKLRTGIEILVKRRPSIEFYEKPIEIKPSLVSDGVKRALYYVLALASSISYAKQKNIRMMLLLEEPEAKIYPYMQELLLYWLKRTVENNVHVVLTTYNPYLVDAIAEEFAEDKLAVYYVYKNPSMRRTGVKRVTKEDLARLTAYSLGDLLVMTPSEINDDDTG